MRCYLTLLTALTLSVLQPNSILAQDGASPIQYSSMAQMFINTTTNGDANTALLPSVAMENGFGSFIDNPASAAMIGTSYLNVDYLTNQTDQTNTFIGVGSDSEVRSSRFSSAGFIYSVPVVRGSMVVGGGYTLNHSPNFRDAERGFNNRSTITDMFQEESSSYYDIAFDTYAIDVYDDATGDVESIFRIGFNPSEFPGIFQDYEITQQGNSGEFSLFTASEISENLFAGASVGLTYGNFRYARKFLEDDRDNLYNTDLIEGSDVNFIEVRDQIDSRVTGLSLRAGLVYKLTSHINVGSSISLPSRLIVREEYFSSIENVLDDGSEPFFSSFDGDFTYAVRRPSTMNFGVALEDLNGFSVSAALDIVNFSGTELDLTRDAGLGIQEESQLREEEALINSRIRNDYNNVVNFRLGGEYRNRQGWEWRAGGGYFPGKSQIFDADRIMLGGGLGVPLSRDVFLDLSVQYWQWEDQSVIYEYFDRATGAPNAEVSNQNIAQLQILGGLKIRL